MKTAAYTKPLTIAFTTETFTRIKSITDQRHISMGEWIRNAAEEALTKEETTSLKGGK